MHISTFGLRKLLVKNRIGYDKEWIKLGTLAYHGGQGRGTHNNNMRGRLYITECKKKKKKAQFVQLILEKKYKYGTVFWN